MTTPNIDESLAQILERGLMQHYGPLLTSDDLRQALGYPSKEAFRQAVARKSVPVPVFDVEKRRGKFALAVDVAKWLATQRERASNCHAADLANTGVQQSDQEGGPMS